MKKFYILFLLTALPLIGFGQTWNFTNTSDGWSKIAATEATQSTYWELTSKDGVNNPGLKITPDPAVDATSVSILAITMKNKSATGPNMIRASAVVEGGSNPGTVYVNMDISKEDAEYQTYYIDYSGAKWDGGGVIGEIKLLFKAADNTNFTGTGTEVFDINKIEFLASIPTIERQVYNFNTDGDSESWSATNGTIVDVASGVLTFAPTADKYAKISLFEGLYHVNLTTASIMIVSLTNLSTDDDELRLTVDGNIIETKTISVSDSGEKSYQFDVSSLTGNTSDIALGFRNADQPVTPGWSSGTGNFLINKIEFLASIPTIERQVYNFNTDGDSESWSATNGTIVDVASGVLTFAPTADKYAKISLFEGLYHVNLTTANTMIVSLTNLSTDDDELRLTVDGNIIETKTISVSDSGEKSYLFDVSNLTGNTSDITLVFRNADQPVTPGWSSGTGNFLINKIEFVSNIIDLIPPVITCPEIEASYNTDSCFSTIVLNATATDNSGLEPVITSNLPLNNQFPTGETSVIFIATDNEGNTSYCEVIINVIESVPPTAIIKNIAIQLDINGQASITPSDIDNGSSDNCEIATLTLDVDNFNCTNIGENEVVLTVTDAVGNNSTATATVTVEDNLAPTVITQDITVQLNPNGIANFTAEQIDNGSTDNCAIERYTLDINEFSPTNIGKNEVVLTVIDTYGNSNTATATVTVEDNLGPIVIAKDITVQLDINGEASITPLMVDNGSTDNSGIDSYTIDITEFTCENIGENEVTLTVTDVNGNSDTATVIVTIEDAIAPTVNTQNITIQLNENGAASITTEQIDNGSSDNCGIESYALDITVFDCSNVGENEVILSVTDVNGNSNTAVAIVTIEDIFAPTAIAVAPFTLPLGDLGSDISITVEDIDNGSTDNICGIASLTIDEDTFDCSNLGENIVTLTVTDVSGNTATATTIITIKDVTVPIVITKDITLDLNDSADATISIDDINDESMDNCSIASITLDRTDFECANLGSYTVTLTVTDSSGNTASEIAIVTVTGDDIDGDLITDNCDPDMDGDGVANEFDNCVTTFNSDQDDVDFNGIGDVCDTTDVSFPQGFSPNGDGIRDTYIVKGLAQHGDNTFEVYNRWGQKVYFSQFYQNNWDGFARGQNVLNKNEKLPAGPYFYLLTSGYNTVYKGWLYINY